MDMPTYALLRKKIGTGTVEAVSDYLGEHLTNPTNPPIDNSLTIENAAADAKEVGKRFTDLKEEFNRLANYTGTKLSINSTDFEIGTYWGDHMEESESTNACRMKNKGTYKCYSGWVITGNGVVTFRLYKKVGTTYTIVSDTSSFVGSYIVPSDGEYCFVVRYANRKNFNDISLCLSYLYVGIIGTIYENINQIGENTGNINILKNASILPTYVGATTVELETNTIKAKKLFDYTSENASPAVWAGGLAFFKNLAFIGYVDGYIAAFNMGTGTILAIGRLADTSSHNNTIFFDYNNIIGDYPVLYASRTYAGYTNCTVSEIEINNSTILTTQIQLIQYSGQYYANDQTVDWVYDPENGYLYALIGKNNNATTILQFEKPDLNSATVTLTDTDILNVATNNDILIRQGSAIYNGLLFVLDGLANGAMRVINPITGTTLNNISLVPMSTYEPEGVAFADDCAYVNFHDGTNRISAHLYKMQF